MWIWFRLILVSCILGVLMLNLSYADQKLPINEFKVGVLATHGGLQAKQRWQPMMDYLSEQVPNSQFEVIPLSYDGITEQVISHQLNFIITNPGQFLHLSGSYPLSWLATMRTRKHQGSAFTVGSAIVVRASSAIHTLDDLRGKDVAALDPQALGGYKAALGLLLEHGYGIDSFFGGLRFLGFPNEALIYQVRDGTVDAAITPFCTLEEMVEAGMIERAGFRVINGHIPAGYECEVSTNLYPAWSFAAMDSVASSLALQVSQALYSLPSDHPAAIHANILGWTSPVSQLKTIELYKKLQQVTTSPYESLQTWIVNNKQWGGALLGLFIISTIYHLWLEYKFRQKSEFLISTERQLKDKALQLERLQSAAILGEIGAGLAHELNQPIAAITQYSEGAMIQLERQGQDNPELYDILDKINAQSIRAGAVVHRIRGLLKRRQAKAEPLNVTLVVKEALALLHHELERAGVQVEVQE